MHLQTPHSTGVSVLCRLGENQKQYASYGTVRVWIHIHVYMTLNTHPCQSTRTGRPWWPWWPCHGQPSKLSTHTCYTWIHTAVRHVCPSHAKASSIHPSTACTAWIYLSMCVCVYVVSVSYVEGICPPASSSQGWLSACSMDRRLCGSCCRSWLSRSNSWPDTEAPFSPASLRKVGLSWPLSTARRCVRPARSPKTNSAIVTPAVQLAHFLWSVSMSPLLSLAPSSSGADASSSTEGSSVLRRDGSSRVHVAPRGRRMACLRAFPLPPGRLVSTAMMSSSVNFSSNTPLLSMSAIWMTTSRAIGAKASSPLSSPPSRRWLMLHAPEGMGSTATQTLLSSTKTCLTAGITAGQPSIRCITDASAAARSGRLSTSAFSSSGRSSGTGWQAGCRG
mmetsp:Transcript_41719/g.118376  ORF Transcript_41719/g.118376 Transcript_41719/m.118376 type:complete len:392 (+) Transcript_41719:294-1469(+)